MAVLIRGFDLILSTFLSQRESKQNLQCLDVTSKRFPFQHLFKHSNKFCFLAVDAV